VQSLQGSYSLPVLIYAVPAMPLTTKQINELGICWTSVIQKLVNYKKWESVKGALHGLVRLNISHLIMLHKLNFIYTCFRQLTVYCAMCLVLHCCTITLVIICCILYSYQMCGS